MNLSQSLEKLGIYATNVLHNASPATLYEHAVSREASAIVDSGALTTRSGAKTGRSPKDKRIIDHAEYTDDIWWGNVNIKLAPEGFDRLRQRARDFLNFTNHLYVVDGYAGWDPKYRLKVRVLCTLAYHALFMRNMLIRPLRSELDAFSSPDFVIYNAGQFPGNPYTAGMNTGTGILVDFKQREFVILGTQYAGEMKKGVFTIMNYLMPKAGVLSMHCSANEGHAGDVALFFGLSGTGKTTLSADSSRKLIGDDEHCWSEEGIFNIEGGCYAKCVNLSEKYEPEIYNAIRFGSVLENVVFDPDSRHVDYTDTSITENTRCAYPIEFIPGAKVPCVGNHPKNIIFLTCDAFGVLPPVSKLSAEQAMFQYLSGYTAKIAGTEVGVTEPEATFSACFGAPFLVWRPAKYAKMLAEKMNKFKANAWLVNTGWTGGSAGTGRRMDLASTRALIAAIHSGALADVPTHVDPIFGLNIPISCPGVPDNLLVPESSWADKSAYQTVARKVANLFRQNFKQYASDAGPEVENAGPRVGG